VIVRGDKNLPQDPVNPLYINNRGFDPSKGLNSLAYFSPIRIDADGDGQVTISREQSKRPKKGSIPKF